MTHVEEVRKELKRMAAGLMFHHPFFSIMLRKMPVILDERIGTAATNGYSIAINPRFWESLGSQERRFVVMHEIMHVVELHPTRGKKFAKYIATTYGIPESVAHAVFNFVADAKINSLLTNLGIGAGSLGSHIPRIEDVARMLDMSYDDVERESVENLAERLIREGKVKIIIVDYGYDPQHGSMSLRGDVRDPGEVFDGDTVNEGSEDMRRLRERIERGGADVNEIERVVRRHVTEAAVSAKMAGRLPAALERIVNEVTKPVVDWRRRLRAALEPFVGRMIYRCPVKPLKRLVLEGEELPSKRTLGMNRVWVLIDTSGSIGAEELKRFVSELYGIVRNVAEMIVVPWDAQMYDPIVVRTRSDIDRMRLGGKIKGGGGTCIKPALEYVSRHIRSGDAVVIMSDWEIFDLDEAMPLLDRIGRLATSRIAVTTYRRPALNGWEIIELRPHPQS